MTKMFNQKKKGATIRWGHMLLWELEVAATATAAIWLLFSCHLVTTAATSYGDIRCS